MDKVRSTDLWIAEARVQGILSDSRKISTTRQIRNTLWFFNIAMENGPFIDDFPIKTSIYKGFSMAMLNNQMVWLVDLKILEMIRAKACSLLSTTMSTSTRFGMGSRLTLPHVTGRLKHVNSEPCNQGNPWTSSWHVWVCLKIVYP